MRFSTPTFLLLPLTFCLLVVSGCDSSSDDGLVCNLAAGPITTGATASVEYSVTFSGDVDLDSVAYTADSGEQPVTNPTSPWSLTRSVPAGTTVSLAADARVRNGTANISMVVTEVSGGGTFTVSDSDACSQTGS